MTQRNRQHVPGGGAFRRRQEWLPERESERARLFAEIEAAFEGVRLDDGISLAQGHLMELYMPSEVAAAARSADDDVRWQDIPDETVDQFAHVFAYLDAKGFRFYAPRFMTFALQHSEGGPYASSVACRVLGTARGVNADSPKYALLTARQFDVVRAFATFFEEPR